VDPGSPVEVFRVFLGLGLTSFGGPVAHLAYFRDAFVVRRKWLDERSYADLVALCQFLPGPASSQVGMAIGLRRAGYGGLLAAWLAFTLPSALLLVAFAYGLDAVGPQGDAGWIIGLKAATVAVVAHAVVGMASTLAPDLRRATVAVAALVLALLIPSTAGQVLAIAAGALLGLLWLPSRDAAPVSGELMAAAVARRTAIACLIVFAALLLALPALAAVTSHAAVTLVDGFYRAGALVFGGGHVVLPLLEAEVVRTGMVDRDAFLAGYGAAQAVPGPLFSFAAYLGTITGTPPGGPIGAALALVAIFLPSALLVVGALPFWDALRRIPTARRAMAGVGAAVVGVLAAALYTPVFTSGITSPATMAVAVAAFVALAAWKVPAWAVVIASSLAGLVVL